ncbi:MAG: hypothetical protein DMF25_10280 [Verrucomicrobia bacterium]|nr:MAG: hypothetical protein DMF25_10280 [Verrucomicrobiota bacterium]
MIDKENNVGIVLNPKEVCLARLYVAETDDEGRIDPDIIIAHAIGLAETAFSRRIDQGWTGGFLHGKRPRKNQNDQNTAAKKTAR